GPFGKSLGYGVKGGGGKVWFIEDGEDGLPLLRLEFRFKRVKPVEVVEAPAMRPRPRKQPTQPERVLLLRERGAPRQRREAERNVFALFFGNRADGGVDHQFRRPVRRAVAANDLLDQPPVASRDRRGDEEAHDLSLQFGHEDAAVGQSLQSLR